MYENALNCCLVFNRTQLDSGYLYFYINNSKMGYDFSSQKSSSLWSNYRINSSTLEKCTTTDGTEIGYMGGGYNAVTGLSYPHFGTCTVPAVTDEEGHLNVKITVSGVE